MKKSHAKKPHNTANSTLELGIPITPANRFVTKGGHISAPREVASIHVDSYDAKHQHKQKLETMKKTNKLQESISQKMFASLSRHTVDKSKPNSPIPSPQPAVSIPAASSRAQALTQLIGSKSLSSLASGLQGLSGSDDNSRISASASMYLALKQRVLESNPAAHSCNNSEVFPPLPKAPYEIFTPYVPPPSNSRVMTSNSGRGSRSGSALDGKASTGLESGRFSAVGNMESLSVDVDRDTSIVANDIGADIVCRNDILDDVQTDKQSVDNAGVDINDSVPVTPMSTARMGNNDGILTTITSNPNVLNVLTVGEWNDSVEEYSPQSRGQLIGDVDGNVEMQAASKSAYDSNAQFSREDFNGYAMPFTADSLPMRAPSQASQSSQPSLPTAKLYSKVGKLTRGLFGHHDGADLQYLINKEKKKENDIVSGNEKKDLVSDYERIMKQIFGRKGKTLPCRAQYATVGRIPLDFKAPHLLDQFYKVLQDIVMRECVLLKVSGVARTLDNQYWKYCVLRIKYASVHKPLNVERLTAKRLRIREAQEELSVGFAHLRAASISVIDSIMHLRFLCKKHFATSSTLSIMWEDENYLLKMTRDVGYFGELATVQFWLGFVPNPFFVPPRKHAPRLVWTKLKSQMETWRGLHAAYLLEQRRLARLERMNNAGITVDSNSRTSRTNSPKLNAISPPLSPVPEFRASASVAVIGLLSSEDNDESVIRSEVSTSSVPKSIASRAGKGDRLSPIIPDPVISTNSNTPEVEINADSNAHVPNVSLSGNTDDDISIPSTIFQFLRRIPARNRPSDNLSSESVSSDSVSRMPSLSIEIGNSNGDIVQPSGNSTREGFTTNRFGDDQALLENKRLPFLMDDVSVPDSIELATSQHWEVLRDYCKPALPAEFSTTHTAEEEQLFWSDAQHNPAVVDAATGFEDVFPSLYLVPPLPAMLMKKCLESEKVLDLEVLIYKSLEKEIVNCETQRSIVQSQLEENTVEKVESQPDIVKAFQTGTMRDRQEFQTLPRIVDTNITMSIADLTSNVLAATTLHSTLRKPSSSSRSPSPTNIGNTYLTEYGGLNSSESRVGFAVGFPESKSAFYVDDVLPGVSFDKLMLSSESLHEQSSAWQTGGRKLKALPVYDPKKFTYVKKVAPRNPLLDLIDQANADDSSVASGDSFSTSHISTITSLDSETHPHIDYSRKLPPSSKLAIISAKQPAVAGRRRASLNDDSILVDDEGELTAESNLETVVGPSGVVVAKTKVYSMNNRHPLSGPVGLSKTRIKSLVTRRNHNSCFIKPLDTIIAPGGLTEWTNDEPNIPPGPPGKRQRHRAARRIQTWVRGFLGRITFARIKADWRKQVAVVNIQRVIRGFLGRRYSKEYRRQRNIDALRRRKDILYKHKASKIVGNAIRTHWEQQSVRRKVLLIKEAQDRAERRQMLKKLNELMALRYKNAALRNIDSDLMSEHQLYLSESSAGQNDRILSTKDNHHHSHNHPHHGHHGHHEGPHHHHHPGHHEGHHDGHHHHHHEAGHSQKHHHDGSSTARHEGHHHHHHEAGHSQKLHHDGSSTARHEGHHHHQGDHDGHREDHHHHHHEAAHSQKYHDGHHHHRHQSVHHDEGSAPTSARSNGDSEHPTRRTSAYDSSGIESGHSESVTPRDLDGRSRHYSRQHAPESASHSRTNSLKLSGRHHNSTKDSVGSPARTAANSSGKVPHNHSSTASSSSEAPPQNHSTTRSHAHQHYVGQHSGDHHHPSEQHHPHSAMASDVHLHHHQRDGRRHSNPGHSHPAAQPHYALPLTPDMELDIWNDSVGILVANDGHHGSRVHSARVSEEPVIASESKLAKESNPLHELNLVIAHPTAHSNHAHHDLRSTSKIYLGPGAALIDAGVDILMSVAGTKVIPTVDELLAEEAEETQVPALTGPVANVAKAVIASLEDGIGGGRLAEYLADSYADGKAVVRAVLGEDILEALDSKSARATSRADNDDEIERNESIVPSLSLPSHAARDDIPMLGGMEAIAKSQSSFFDVDDNQDGSENDDDGSESSSSSSSESEFDSVRLVKIQYNPAESLRDSKLIPNKQEMLRKKMLHMKDEMAMDSGEHSRLLAAPPRRAFINDAIEATPLVSNPNDIYVPRISRVVYESDLANTAPGSPSSIRESSRPIPITAVASNVTVIAKRSPADLLHLALKSAFDSKPK